VSHGVSEFCRRRALELYPQLRDAVPPKDIGPRRENPLRVGEFPFAVQNAFWSWHQQDHALRVSHDNAAVIGPLKARGWCLHPLRTDGDLMWFDPTLQAQHGDIVLVQFEYPDTPAAERNELGFMGKVLVEFADEYWLAFNTGMFPLGDIKILGAEVRNPHRASCAQGRTYDAAQPQRGHGTP
jgi:hypothetical protein